MSTAAGPVKEETFMFFSFLQNKNIARKLHADSKSSNDSGIGGISGEDQATILLSDDEYDPGEESEPEFELICEMDMNTGNPLPLPQPMEQKPIFKLESDTSPVAAALLAETNASSSMCDVIDDEMPLCKVELNIDEGADSGSSNINNFILFICPQCGKPFELGSEWRTHINTEHQLSEQRTFDFIQRRNNEFECNQCHTVMTRCTLRSLQQHRFTHLPYKVYRCKLCPYAAHTQYLMLSHIMLHKNIEDLDVGESMVRVSVALEYECRKLMAYICPACGMTFDAEDDWQAHINFRHDFLEKTAENRYGDHFKCSECGVELFSQHVADLQQHLFTHLPHKAFLKCTLCNWTTSRRNFMISHILNLHKNRFSSEATKECKSNKHMFNYNAETGKSHAAVVRMRKPSSATILPTPIVECKKRSVSEIVVGSATGDITAVDGATVDRDTAVVPPTTASSVSIYPVSLTDRTKKKRRQSNVDPKDASEFKSSHQCKNCGKAYNYEKCYQKHIRKCRLSPASAEP